MAAVATVWTTLLAATAATGFDLVGEDPLSHLGAQPDSAALFTIGLAVPAVLLGVFHQYVKERYAVAPGFSSAMLIGLTGQMVAAVVPIGGDPAAHGIHTASALVLGASLPLLMWRFAAGQPPGRWRRLTYALLCSEAVACAVGLYLSARMVAPLAEILPGAVFHAWVIVVTLARPPVPAQMPRGAVARGTRVRAFEPLLAHAEFGLPAAECRGSLLRGAVGPCGRHRRGYRSPRVRALLDGLM